MPAGPRVTRRSGLTARAGAAILLSPHGNRRPPRASRKTDEQLIPLHARERALVRRDGRFQPPRGRALRLADSGALPRVPRLRLLGGPRALDGRAPRTAPARGALDAKRRGQLR